MIITIVCDVLGVENNGTATAAYNFIRSMREKGHTVRVVSADQDKIGVKDNYVMPVLSMGPFNGYVKKVGVTLARTDKNILYEAIKGADVVHLLLPFGMSRKAIKICKKLNVPITTSTHCQAENLTSHLFLDHFKWATHLAYRNFYNHVYRHVDCIHYPTKFIKDDMKKHGYINTNDYVISNGVTSRFAKSRVDKPLEYKDKYVILFAGRFSREKNHKFLINAIKLSPYKNKIQLIFAGVGQLEDSIRKLGSKLPNPPIIKYFTKEELVKVMNYADLYVHPSKIELEGISLLEAMACGLVPIVSTSKRSATKHFALYSENLFDCNSPLDLASKISFWLENPKLKEKVSEEYVKYSKHFDYEICMNQMEKMLFDAIKINDKKSEIKNENR